MKQIRIFITFTILLLINNLPIESLSTSVKLDFIAQVYNKDSNNIAIEDLNCFGIAINQINYKIVTDTNFIFVDLILSSEYRKDLSIDTYKKLESELRNIFFDNSNMYCKNDIRKNYLTNDSVFYVLHFFMESRSQNNYKIHKYWCD